MAQRWCYLGRLGPGDALDWNGPSGGNVPASGTLPDIHDHALWIAISSHAADGRSDGRIIDYDAYGIRVNGPELAQVLRDAFAKTPERLTQEPVSQYLAYADALGPDRRVALVAVAL